MQILLPSPLPIPPWQGAEACSVSSTILDPLRLPLPVLLPNSWGLSLISQSPKSTHSHRQSIGLQQQRFCLSLSLPKGC